MLLMSPSDYPEIALLVFACSGVFVCMCAVHVKLLCYPPFDTLLSFLLFFVVVIVAASSPIVVSTTKHVIVMLVIPAASFFSTPYYHTTLLMKNKTTMTISSRPLLLTYSLNTSVHVCLSVCPFNVLQSPRLILIKYYSSPTDHEPHNPCPHT